MFASFLGWVTAKNDDPSSPRDAANQNQVSSFREPVETFSAVENNNNVANKSNKKKKRKNKKKKEVTEDAQSNENLLDTSLAAESIDSQDDNVKQEEEGITGSASNASLEEQASSSLVDPVQVVVSEVYQKLSLKHPDAKIQRDAVNMFVMDMWEKHLPYDNVDAVLEAWAREHNTSTKTSPKKATPAPTPAPAPVKAAPVEPAPKPVAAAVHHHVEPEVEAPSTETHHKQSHAAPALSEADSMMVARLEQVCQHTVLTETLAALSQWGDLTNQADNGETGLNVAGDIFFKSRSLEMLLESLRRTYGTSVFVDGLFDFVALLKKFLPVYHASPAALSASDPLLVHLGKVFELIAPYPKSHAVIIHRVAESIRCYRLQATLTASAANNADPVTAALLLNEAIFQQLFQNHHIKPPALEATPAALYACNQVVPVARPSQGDLVNSLKKAMDVPVAASTQSNQAAAVKQLEGQLRELDQEMTSLIARREEAQRVLENLHHSIDAVQAKSRAIQNSLAVEKAKVAVIREDGASTQLADKILDIEGKLQYVVVPICAAVANSTSTPSPAMINAGSYLESAHNCFQLISNQFVQAKETEGQLRGEIATYEKLGLRQNVVAYNAHLIRVQATMAQLEATSRALQKEFHALISFGLAKHELMKSQQILSFLASAPHLTTIAELHPMLPKSSVSYHAQVISPAVTMASATLAPAPVTHNSSEANIRRTPSNGSFNAPYSPGRPGRNNSGSIGSSSGIGSSNSRSKTNPSQARGPSGLVLGSNGELKLNMTAAKAKPAGSLSLVANK